MNRTFYYKAVISKKTEQNCNQWINTCRTLYNVALDQKISIFRQYKQPISAFQQNRQLTELRKYYPEFKTINAQCLEDVIMRLDKAFQTFFCRFKKGMKTGFPRFKGVNRYHSFTLRQSGWKLKGKYLHISRVGRFKLFFSRPITGKIKRVTISRTSTNKWFVFFCCSDVPKKTFPQVNTEVGIDVGITNFCVDSMGNRIKNPKFLQRSIRLMRRQNRRLTRRKEGSTRRNKARILIAKVYEKITNQRKDFLHKVANSYISQYQTIYVENLDIEDMLQNRLVARGITDSSWWTFFNILSYKAEEAGRTVIKVNPRGTTQICSGCGEKVTKPLTMRIHRCPFCKLVLDRDYNAALNILRVGQTHQASTLASAGVV